MSDSQNPQKTKASEAEMTREERLAAKLRENLRRRKAQARALADTGSDDEDNAESQG